MDTVKRSHQSNLTTWIVWRDRKFVEIMRTVLFYASISLDQYDIPFSDFRTPDIASDLESSKWLRNESRLTYICYIRVTKAMMTHNGLQAF